MRINRIDIIGLTLVGLLGVYLVVQAPAPLADRAEASGELIPIETLFRLIAEENNHARRQWTKYIVVAGQKSGLKFGEQWKENDTDQGPLPALYLREVATNLEKSQVPLSLFLGSDYPISSANKFKGRQAQAFQLMRDTNGEAQFFFSGDIQRHTAMFPDYVVVEACAYCHNEHSNTPKDDWVLNDIMGATTWAYPKDAVTRDEAIEVIVALRGAFEKAYISFLDKSKTYLKPPEIGNKWPDDGYFIPSAAEFITRFEHTASTDTLRYLLNAASTSESILLVLKDLSKTMN